VLSARAAAAGSLRGRLVWLGMLDYVLYDFGFYLFGAVLNLMFVAYAALVGGAAMLLVAGLVTLDLHVFEPVAAARRLRGVVAWLALIALGLGSFWIVTLVGAAGSAEPTEPSVKMLQVIGSLDLTLVVPVHALAAVLLARRRAWGIVLGAVASVKGAVYMLALTASTGTAWSSGALDDPTQAVLWIVIGAGSSVASWALLRAVQGRVSVHTPDSAIPHIT
jgi:hypothetical protein